MLTQLKVQILLDQYTNMLDNAYTGSVRQKLGIHAILVLKRTTIPELGFWVNFAFYLSL